MKEKLLFTSDMKTLFKSPKGPNAISCCNTPQFGFEMPLEYDSVKFLDPDDLMESLLKRQYTTDDFEVLAERATNVFNAYNGILETEVVYNVQSNRLTPGYETLYFGFNNDRHRIQIAPKRNLCDPIYSTKEIFSNCFGAQRLTKK